ncbi:MAG: EAL domain-containing protein [Mycobacteriales bacterium]
MLLLNADGRTMRQGAAPSMPPEFLAAIDGAEVGPNEGSCGAAMFRRAEVIAEDIATDPMWVTWRLSALPAGLRACWSTPLLSADTRPAERRVLGSFAVYWDEPHSPTEDERRLVSTTAHITAIAIERAQAEQALADANLTDPLTGLGNRRLFPRKLGEALSKAGDNATVAVLYLDLDGFKFVNDSMGHDVGDQLLRPVGARLSGVLRPDDTAARLGGDEFAIICENSSDVHAAEVLAERARRVLTAPFRVAGREVFATASVGLSVGSSSTAPARLVQDADAAMYRAKARSRARVEVFDDELRARSYERMQLATGLRQALDRDEFTLNYQPVIELATGRLTALEALLRWKSPDMGPIPPDSFIPVAEDTGLISEIGAWVIEQTCRQYAVWRRRHEEMPVIAVNVSPRQLADSGLVRALSGALSHHDVPVEAIRIELTETALADATAGNTVLAELSRLGLRFSVDDFGTGHSSLARLRSMPVPELKIDRSFIDGLGMEPEASAIVSAVVRMAAELSLDVVAEGVETRTQLDELRKLGCAHVQGFLYARPAPAAAFDDVLGDHVWAPVG